MLLPLLDSVRVLSGGTLLFYGGKAAFLEHGGGVNAASALKSILRGPAL
jgi:hypothetical protein